MPAPKTIACPKCSTPLRVRSLNAVSTTDACPECGALLKAAAERKKAEGESVHPALKKPEKKPESEPVVEADSEVAASDSKSSPATIAAISTGILALMVIAGLSWGTPDPEPQGWVPGSDGESTATAPDQPGSGEETPSGPGPSELIASTDPESNPKQPGESETANPDSALPGETVAPSEAVTKPEEEPPTEPGTEEAGPKAVTAEGPNEPGKPESIKPVVGTDDGNPAPPPPGTRPTTPAPPKPKPAPVEERLAFPIARFELREPVTLKSLLETVEIMAEIQIDADEAVPAATLDRLFAFSLEETSPRGILDEAAKRAGLSATLKDGRIILSKATD